LLSGLLFWTPEQVCGFSGPVSDALLKYDSMRNIAAGAYGFRNYVCGYYHPSVSLSLPNAVFQLEQGALLLYTGLTMVAGGISGITCKG
jgi:hypothetical protein